MGFIRCQVLVFLFLPVLLPRESDWTITLSTHGVETVWALMPVLSKSQPHLVKLEPKTGQGPKAAPKSGFALIPDCFCRAEAKWAEQEFC
jgi:hypothetical protein